MGFDRESAWERFTKSQTSLSYIFDNIDKESGEGCYEINYNEILSYDQEMAEDLVNHPEEIIGKRSGMSSLLSDLLNLYARASDQEPSFIRADIRNLPDHFKRTLKSLKSTDTGKLRYAEVQVTRRTKTNPRVVKAVYQCSSCGFNQELNQESFTLNQPLECPKDEGGCGKRAGSTTFKFVEEDSVWVDQRHLTVQDDLSISHNLERPEALLAIIEGAGDVEKAEMGDRLKITFISKMKQVEKGSSNFQIYLEIVGLVKVEDITTPITNREIQIFESFGDSILDLGPRSIAPHILGFDVIKLSLFLQFIGAPTIRKNSGAKERGEIHILLLGDMGTGKSKLLMDIREIWPNSKFTGAQNASKVGLTAAFVKDEILKEWVIEPGVLVLARGTLAAIEELDKATPAERGALHMVMEDQIISASKAGRSVEIPSNPTIIAAANQKEGLEMLDDVPAHKLCELEQSLLDRFTLVWKIPRDTDRARSRKRDEHGLKASNKDNITGKRPLSIPLLRKYKKYAEQFNPDIPEEMNEPLLNKIEEVREVLTSKIPNHKSGRLAEDLKRLAKSSARARLHSHVDSLDIDLAGYILKKQNDLIINGYNDEIGGLNYIGGRCIEGDDIRSMFLQNRPISSSEVIAVIKNSDDGRGVNTADLEAWANSKGLFNLQDVLAELFSQGLIKYPRLERVSLNEGVES